MEKKIEMLRESIKQNPNLTEEFKCNLGTLTDTLVTVFPGYDYTNYGKILSTLGVYDDVSIEGYSIYNNDTNSIGINTKNIFEDRIDMQHLFLGELLQIGSGTKNMPYEVEGFNKGLTEAIASTMNNDESMKKLNPLEYTGISIFSKIIDPQVLIDSYMNGDFGNIFINLEAFGITQDEFRALLYSFNEMSKPVVNNESFVNAEVLMINMYGKVIELKLKNGQITYDDLSREYDDLSEMLIFNKSELISLYPHHDFSNINGFDKVKSTLDKTVVNSEFIDEEEFIK